MRDRCRWVVGSCLLLMAMCVGLFSTAPAQQPEVSVTDALKPPWELNETPRVAHIYVDLSESMAGFTRGRDSDLYELAVRLREYLYRQGIHRLEGAGFGEVLDPLRGLNGIVETLEWKTRYDETCLALPVMIETVPDSVSGEPAPLMLVITDGVASAVHTACGAGCAEGSDITCVARALHLYVRNGRALWLIGVRLPFQGYYYPEIGSRRSLNVQGVVMRPLYLWVGAKDIQVGRAIVRDITQWARSRGGGSALAVEVWPGGWHGGWRPGTIVSRGWVAGDFAGSQELHEACETRRPLKLRWFDPAITPPSLTLRAAGKEEDRIWVGGIPLLPVEAEVGEGWTGLVDVTGTWPPIAEQAQILDLVMRDPPIKAGMQSRVRFCLYVPGTEARLSMGWTAQVDAAIFRPWSCEDDSKQATLGTTLNLEQLWGLVGDDLGRDVNESLRTTLLRICVK